ncbi:MAG: rhodanese-like domain-containing protein [Verrucomicrobiales bacterium]|nr:rhodanese-like domain-containing protein [Verrucomicrobiales bacterium]
MRITMVLCAGAIPCLGAELSNGLGVDGAILVQNETLGVPAPHEESTHTVVWTNRGVTPFEVRRVSTSCDCVHVLAYSLNVRPGDSLDLRVRIAPETTGDFIYLVSVEGAKGQPALLARFEVSVGGPDQRNATHGFDPSTLLMAPSEAMKQNLLGAGWMLVDVRPPERYLLGHLPGAFNLSLGDVRVRPYLKRKAILVVGDGYDSERLVTDAAELAEAGFSQVRVLDGGIRRWQQEGGVLDGAGTSLARLFTLTPGEALPLLGRPSVAWLSVLEQDRDFDARPLQLPATREVTLEQLPAVLGGLAAGNNHQPSLSPSSRTAGNTDRVSAGNGTPARYVDTPTSPRCIVVSSDNEQVYADLEREWGMQPALPLFFVEGGHAGVAEAVAVEARLAERRTMTVVSGEPAGSVRTRGGGGRRGCCGGAN